MCCSVGDGDAIFISNNIIAWKNMALGGLFANYLSNAK
jgi:hypothetical protein